MNRGEVECVRVHEAAAGVALIKMEDRANRNMFSRQLVSGLQDAFRAALGVFLALSALAYACFLGTSGHNRPPAP